MTRITAVACGDALGLVAVTGNLPAQAGAHTRLAIRIVDAVRAAGFLHAGIATSKFTESRSRYVDFDDRMRRRWRIRVSDHLRPARSTLPHLDLVSLDGLAGMEQVEEFLGLAISGAMPWFDSIATSSLVSGKVRRRIARCR